MGGVKANPLDTRGVNGVRKYGEDGIDRSTAPDDFDAEDLRSSGLGRGRQGHDLVQQMNIPTVH
jgi:hypothetical protein